MQQEKSTRWREFAVSTVDIVVVFSLTAWTVGFKFSFMRLCEHGWFIIERRRDLENWMYEQKGRLMHSLGKKLVWLLHQASYRLWFPIHLIWLLVGWWYRTVVGTSWRGHWGIERSIIMVLAMWLPRYIGMKVFSGFTRGYYQEWCMSHLWLQFNILATSSSKSRWELLRIDIRGSDSGLLGGTGSSYSLYQL